MSNKIISDFKTEGTDLIDRLKAQMTVKNLVRYILEGLSVILACYVIPNRRTRFNEIAIISLVASLTLFILDLFSADVAKGTRFGAGFQAGLNLVNNAPMKLPYM